MLKYGASQSAVRAGRMPSDLVVGVFLFLLISLAISLSGGQAKASLADHAVINEVSIDSLSGSGGTEDDWVELYNPTAQAIDLSGWSIQKTSGTGGSLVKASLSGAIPAEGYFLIVRDNIDTDQALKDLADILVSDSFSLAQDNIIYLVNNNIAISGAADPDIVDLVGFGEASYYEGAAPAPEIPEAKSISRVPAGEDTDENSLDFLVLNTPTPTNAAASSDDDNGLGGTVVLTITPDAEPAQNINSTDAQIVFQVNAAGTALVRYGLDITYGDSTAAEAVAANTTKAISLTGLACATTYHYAIYAENAAGTENDITGDAVFTTLPCGITLDSLVMTKSSAKANDQYASGWQWEFNITVWNLNETSLKMKFNQWSGAGSLDAGANMQYSADDGMSWRDITANDAYPDLGVSLSGIDNDGAAAGRQVKILVRMKVPVGTVAGYYNSSYGILTE